MSKKIICCLMFVCLVIAGSAVGDLKSDRANADLLMQEGKEKDAFKAYRTLARDGDHDSQYVLSTLYATGTGTKTNLNDAYGWAVLAAEAGLPKLDEHASAMLAATDNQKKAEKTARSLMNKYGKAALEEKAERLATRGSGRRNGSCTGSRLRCSNVTGTAATQVGGAGPPPQASGGN